MLRPDEEDALVEEFARVLRGGDDAKVIKWLATAMDRLGQQAVQHMILVFGRKHRDVNQWRTAPLIMQALLTHQAAQQAQTRAASGRVTRNPAAGAAPGASGRRGRSDPADTLKSFHFLRLMENALQAEHLTPAVLREQQRLADDSGIELVVLWRRALEMLCATPDRAAQIGILGRNVGDESGKLLPATVAPDLAIECFTATFGELTNDAHPKAWATNHVNMAVNYLRRVVGDALRNTELAIESLNAALSVYSRAEHPEMWANIQITSGMAFRDRLHGDMADNLERALVYFRAALTACAPDVQPAHRGRALSHLGATLAKRIKGERAMNVEDAIDCFTEALEFRTRETSPEAWAITQCDLGSAYMIRVRGEASQNIERAIECYESALEVLTADKFPDAWLLATGNLGVVYTKRLHGDAARTLDKAIELCAEALEAHSLREPTLRWADASISLGDALVKRGGETDVETAITLYQAVLSEFALESAPRVWVQTQLHLGSAYLKRSRDDSEGDADAAIQCTREALRLITRDGDAMAWARVQEQLGTAFAKRGLVGDAELAVDCFNSALSVHFSYRSLLRRSGDAVVDKAAVARDIAACVSKLLRCLTSLDRVVEAVELIERARAASLAELKDAATDSSIQHGSSERKAWVTARAALRSAQRALEVAEASGTKADVAWAKAVDRAAEAAESRAREALVAAEPTLELARDMPPLDHVAMQQILADDAVALYFFLSEHFSGVFVVAKDLPIPRMLVYSDADSMRIKTTARAFADHVKSKCPQASFAAWHEALARRLADVADAMRMHDVHALLKKRPDKSSVVLNCPSLVIMPHSELHAIPIDALPIQELGGATLSAIYNAACFYAPSLRLCSLARGHDVRTSSAEGQPPPTSLVAVQNPTGDLPGADDEVRWIAKLFGCVDSVVLAGDAATKAALAGRVEDAEARGSGYVLHLACHGKHESRWETGVILAQNERLAVGDIITWNVRSCRLCVASACSTALNDSITDAASENIGIPSALLVAGVPCVVAGLWRVDDAATALLMSKLYELLHRGALVSRALSEAQHWLRGLRAHEVEASLAVVGNPLLQRWTRSQDHGADPSATVALPPGRLWWSADALRRAGMSSTAECSDASAVWRHLCAAASTTPQSDHGGLARGAPEPGLQFTEADWSAFADAVRCGRAEPVATHLFPVLRDDRKGTIPERDFWFRADLATGPTWVIVHVHYLGSWEELDETRVAQVNVRFPSDTGRYQFEAHPEIASGIMTTPFSFRATAQLPVNPTRKKDPTQWMGGRANEPPPWEWRHDPDRSKVGPFSLHLPGRHKPTPFEYDAVMRQRFQDAHDAIALGMDTLAAAPSGELSSTVPVGGRERDCDMMNPDDRPFASPLFWAGFIITGWGGTAL